MVPKGARLTPYGTPAPLAQKFQWEQMAEAAAPIATSVAQKPLPVSVPKYKGAARDATMFNPGGARMDDLVGTLLLTLAVHPTLDLAESARRVMHDVGTGIGANRETPQAGVEDVANLAMTVFHGSPYKFGKFSLSKVGTGEGAQAFGYGTYLAEKQGTARTYQWMAPDEIRVGAERIVGKTGIAGRNDATTKAWNEVTAAFGGQHTNPFATAKERLSGRYGPRDATDADAIKIIEDWQRKGATVEKGGYLYHVDLPDEDIAKMLDWDAPLTQQPEFVKKALASVGLYDEAHIRGNAALGNTLNGEWAYKAIGGGGGPDAAYGNAVEASEKLRQLGIPGIKYLDATSRGAGAGSRNFVVFQPEKLKILKVE